MAEQRRQTTQPVAWFLDLHRRNLLELSPPYQRRSVWNQSYKDYFVDTVLLNYPAPAVFLFEDITDEGVGNYAVVDGKQRLQTVFDFIKGEFPVSEKASIPRLRGLHFSEFGSAEKRSLYAYQFSIEFLPSTDEGTLSNIFDRINRNVAKLTAQELRHAKYSGIFAATAERLTEEMTRRLPTDFPRIASSSKRQMKDVELVVNLLLLTERGVESYSQSDLDAAYSDRDEDWEVASEVEEEFLQTVALIKELAEGLLSGEAKRLRNQADFYSLYGSLLQLKRAEKLPDSNSIIQNLNAFMASVNSEDARADSANARRYYEAARSNSNDPAQRRDRISLISNVITGVE
ncbi:DUF262 domain-containing protein [Actinoplanes sp. NEAU-A12]|uniref:DUF262 domain-containing protein n=1 Tax=Actinoplanes sandaracinus TaxID=3045177 RepID=A0ABT6WQV7_9ACTN|nr:DUF262 domain-containing protein [Actinoplanes sandaracinus]MDI6102109.1 DUF262 domain-containing protein [Actinoplanes sandaracinus]